MPILAWGRATPPPHAPAVRVLSTSSVASAAVAWHGRSKSSPSVRGARFFAAAQTPKRQGTEAEGSDTVRPPAVVMSVPSAIGRGKVEMSDKWQQINLKLEAPLAQALRDLKHGHDEPLSEVILRLLWKAVRQQNPLGGRGAVAGRSRGGRSRDGGARESAGGRGGFAADRRGKAAAPRGRAAKAAAGKGRKAFVPREASAEGEWGGEGASVPPRAPRNFGGKPRRPFRPQPEGSGEAPKRAFRARPEGRRSPSPRDEDASVARPRRPGKAKGTRARKG